MHEYMAVAINHAEVEAFLLFETAVQGVLQSIVLSSLYITIVLS